MIFHFQPEKGSAAEIKQLASGWIIFNCETLSMLFIHANLHYPYPQNREEMK